MDTATQDFTIRGGATFRFPFTLASNDIRVAVTGATGGTLRLVYRSTETTDIAFDATPSTVQTALNAIAELASAGGVTVSGSASTWVISPRGALGGDEFEGIGYVSALTGTNPFVEVGHNPMDVTGWTGALQIRQFHNHDVSNPALLSVTETESTDGQIIIGTTDGAIEIWFKPAATDALDFDNPAYYDLELTDTTGDIWRVLEGILTLSKGVTA